MPINIISPVSNNSTMFVSTIDTPGSTLYNERVGTMYCLRKFVTVNVEPLITTTITIDLLNELSAFIPSGYTYEILQFSYGVQNAGVLPPTGGWIRFLANVEAPNEPSTITLSINTDVDFDDMDIWIYMLFLVYQP